MVDRTLDITALAFEVHAGELREDLGALSDDASELDKGVQVDLSELSEFVLDGELCDPHEDVRVEVTVVRIDFLNDVVGY